MEFLESEAAAEQGSEFLIFNLGGEEYAIDILRVQEIRRYEKVTTIASAPSCIKGVINLRGAIVPLVDMRIRFALKQVDYNEFTAVIVLTLRQRVIGMVVDGVTDVISLTAEQVRPAPTLGTNIETRYITGIGTVDQRMIILADIDRLMSDQDIGLLEQAAA